MRGFWGMVMFARGHTARGYGAIGIALAILPFTAVYVQAANSIWVKAGASSRLIYTLDDTGDRIEDFSTVGYKGGLVPLPTYSSVVTPERIVTVTPTAGDNLSNLQAAINKVAAMSVNTNGFRGVVQLAPGNYNISAGLSINTDGVIFRGSGQGGNTAVDSILSYTGTSQIDMIHVDSSASRSNSNTHNIADKVVPVGASSFTVDSTAGFAVGDNIQINRPSPANWIHDIEMDTLDMPWTAGSKNESYDRKIVYIDQTRKRIFFDAPLPNSFDQQYGGGTLSKTTFNRTTNVGIENLRGNGQAVLTTPTDEAHANSFVVMQDTADGWARNITGQHLVYATMEAGTGSRNITLDGGNSIEPISQITGGRRYPFNIEGQFVLMKNMTSDEGRHEFVNNSPSRGPNVFLDGVATHGHADSGTHQRWSTGTLWDNITTNTDINVQNRGNWGTGHGWSGANMVIWNSKASDFYVQNPETAQNWLIGSTGTVHSTSQNWPGSYPAYYDANNVGSKVTLNGETSLYRAQLNQRVANPEVTREYWVGDFDGYVNDGASESTPVDATWLSTVQSFKPTNTVVGFDGSLSQTNISVPFTLDYDAPGSRIKSAILTLAVHATGGTSANDRIYLNSTSNSVTFSSLGTLPHFGNSDIVMLEFTSADAVKNLTALQNGKLNLLVSDNHAVDWADLQFTVASKNLSWTAASSGNWDINTTQNWNDGVAGDKYFDGDTVTFGNATNRTVTIASAVAPAAVIVNNAAGNDYTIGGASINGPATLSKTGAGAATLTGANAFTGATFVTGGTLKVGNQAALGSATDELDGTFVTGGGTLDINGFALGTQQERIAIAGAGVGGLGALVNNGADQTNGTRFVSLIADATIGGTGRLDVRGSSSTSNPPTGILNLSGYTLTKVGANKLAIVATRVTDGNIIVNQGTLSIETTSIVQGNGTITMNAGTTLQFYDNTTTGNITRDMVFSGITVDNQNRAAEIVDSDITFGGNNTFSIGTSSTNMLTLNGVLSETGGPRTLTKTGAGILALAGANTFSGDAKVSGGTLRLDQPLALQNSTLDYGNYGGVISFGSQTSATLGGLKGAQSLALTNAASGAVALSVGKNGASTAYSGVLSGGGSLTKIGTGTLTLAGASSYTGDTTISGGTLLLGAANRIADTSRLVLSGGVLATGGFSEMLGAFKLSANSSLDFGSGSSVLHFANSSAQTWSNLLSVLNWDGRWGATGGGMADKLFVGSSASGLTATQLSEINFAGFAPAR